MSKARSCFLCQLTQNIFIQRRFHFFTFSFFSAKSVQKSSAQKKSVQKALRNITMGASIYIQSENSCFYSGFSCVFLHLCLWLKYLDSKKHTEKHLIGCIHMETDHNTSNDFLGPCSDSLGESTLTKCPYTTLLSHQKHCYYTRLRALI